MVYVTITDSEGIVLDRFPVTHWKDKAGYALEDGENYGSHASNSNLAQRIEREAEKAKS
jgi:hypothetical protein